MPAAIFGSFQGRRTNGSLRDLSTEPSVSKAFWASVALSVLSLMPEVVRTEGSSLVRFVVSVTYCRRLDSLAKLRDCLLIICSLAVR